MTRRNKVVAHWPGVPHLFKLGRENSTVPQISQLFVVQLCFFFSTSLPWQPEARARQQVNLVMAIKNHDWSQTTVWDISKLFWSDFPACLTLLCFQTTKFCYIPVTNLFGCQSLQQVTQCSECKPLLFLTPNHITPCSLSRQFCLQFSSTFLPWAELISSSYNRGKHQGIVPFLAFCIKGQKEEQDTG